MPEPRVSVIVVSYNTREKLKRCLAALADVEEVIVVDNASTDGSGAMVQREFPRVLLIQNSRNSGFGAANNQGMLASTRDWVLYLNSDAYADVGAITRLVDAAESSGAIAAGGMLLNPDRTLQESVAKELSLWRVFLEQTLLEPILRRWNAGYWETRFVAARQEVSEVAQVMGACLLMRRDSGEPFDERFFLYCEDTELCLRLKRKGSIVYVPDATFIHELGSSSGDRRWLAVARYNRGKELYFRIHRGVLAANICWLLNRAGALIRLVGWSVVAVFAPSRRSQVGLFARVLLARAV